MLFYVPGPISLFLSLIQVQFNVYVALFQTLAVGLKRTGNLFVKHQTTRIRGQKH